MFLCQLPGIPYLKCQCSYLEVSDIPTIGKCSLNQSSVICILAFFIELCIYLQALPKKMLIIRHEETNIHFSVSLPYCGGLHRILHIAISSYTFIIKKLELLPAIFFKGEWFLMWDNNKKEHWIWDEISGSQFRINYLLPELSFNYLWKWGQW